MDDTKIDWDEPAVVAFLDRCACVCDSVHVCVVRVRDSLTLQAPGVCSVKSESKCILLICTHRVYGEASVEAAGHVDTASSSGVGSVASEESGLASVMSRVSEGVSSNKMDSSTVGGTSLGRRGGGRGENVEGTDAEGMSADLNSRIKAMIESSKAGGAANGQPNEKKAGVDVNSFALQFQIMKIVMCVWMAGMFAIGCFGYCFFVPDAWADFVEFVQGKAGKRGGVRDRIGYEGLGASRQRGGSCGNMPAQVGDAVHYHSNGLVNGHARMRSGSSIPV